ncbi:MAG: hypothetical protein JWP66_2082, partial [Naasia sp.]|nr:hypothetical protein [Naasia sp.]
MTAAPPHPGIRRTVALLAAAVVVLALLVATPPSSASAAVRGSDTIFALTNQVRAQYGLAPLRRSPALDLIATAWATRMAKANT